MNVVRLAAAMLLSIALPLAFQLADKRRLPETVRLRAWNAATWGASLYAFGPLSMLGWFWVTRPRWTRVWQGGLATGASLGLVELADVALVRLVGVNGASAGASLVDAALAAGVAAAGGAALLAVFELVVAVRRRMH